ncbi:hypothetical protein ACFVG1_01375 [Streptomyces bacillaris]|uniref:hypothetical protein n=1 Tax=Streptomyces bacillaris TaxID=68179 RepID=UPI00335782C4
MAAASSPGGGFRGWDGWEDCEFIPLGQNLPEGGFDVALDTLALRGIRKHHFAGGEFADETKGLFRADLTLADMRNIFNQAITDPGQWKQANGGAAYREKSVRIDRVVGLTSKKSGEEETKWINIVVSVHGDLVTMYPTRG